MPEPITVDGIQRLARAVHDKIISRQALIAAAEGEIVVRIFRRGQGFDIKLTITTT
jgi:hypothetical protein